MKTKSVLVLNSGSSSLKFGLFEEESGAAIMSGSVTNIIDSAKLTVKLGSTVIEEEIGKSSHADAVRRIMGFASKDMKYVLSGVGHRVVHGGKIFLSPTVINDDVLSKLKDLIVLAPLHQQYNIEGIKAISFMILI